MTILEIAEKGVLNIFSDENYREVYSSYILEMSF